MKKLIGLWDLHYPIHNKKLWNNILRFTKDFQPDYWVFGGDNMDMTPISHWLHEGGQFRTLEGKRIIKDYKGFQVDVIDKLEKVLSNKCSKQFLLGNHEDWVEQAINKNPQGEGYWEIENNLDLRQWNIVEYGKHIKIGKAYFIHGAYTNDLHTKKTVLTYGKNIFYGHVHTEQVFTATTPLDNESHQAISVPCACDMNPDYARNKPNSWIQGFLVMYLMPNGNFNKYIVTTINGNFVAPNGVLYRS